MIAFFKFISNKNNNDVRPYQILYSSINEAVAWNQSIKTLKGGQWASVYHTTSCTQHNSEPSSHSTRQQLLLPLLLMSGHTDACVEPASNPACRWALIVSRISLSLASILLVNKDRETFYTHLE